MTAFFFYAFGALAILGGLGTILNRHPIASALSLVLSFFAVASIYAMLDAHLLAALQVIVYIGAIMVFIIYTILLMDIRESDLRGRLGVNRGIAVGLGLVWAIYFFRGIGGTPLQEAGPTPEGFGTVKGIARVLFTDYVYAFELVGFLLLAALVGALVLALQSGRDRRPDVPGEEPTP